MRIFTHITRSILLLVVIVFVTTATYSQLQYLWQKRLLGWEIIRMQLIDSLPIIIVGVILIILVIVVEYFYQKGENKRQDKVVSLLKKIANKLGVDTDDNGDEQSN